MSIEMMLDDDLIGCDDDVLQYEFWYWSIIEGMADLVMNNGRDKVMADVAETVLRRIGNSYESSANAAPPL
jgi:hypothetical protein